MGDQAFFLRFLQLCCVQRLNGFRCVYFLSACGCRARKGAPSLESFVVNLAGCCLNVHPRYAETESFFRSAYPPCREAAAWSPDCLEARLPDVAIPAGDWQLSRAQGMPDCAHTEYSFLTAYCSDALMEFSRLVIHAVALRFRDRAWLICGKSGAGKSTQAKLLQQLCPGAFGIICGDRPILQFCPSESSTKQPQIPAFLQSLNPSHGAPGNPILVHPSPWNGKENWYGAEAAPLAGVILLERGEENRLYCVSEEEAVIPVYLQLIQSSWEPQTIRRAAAMESAILQAVPVWKLVSRDVPDSTRLLLEAVFCA